MELHSELHMFLVATIVAISVRTIILPIFVLWMVVSKYVSDGYLRISTLCQRYICRHLVDHLCWTSCRD